MEPAIRAAARPATLAEINAVMGTVPRGATAAIVSGVNPEKINCRELHVADRVSITGRMASHIIGVNGTLSDAAYGFANGDLGTGLYSSAPLIFNATSGGQVIAQFAPTGLGVTNIFSPTSVIDFHGATLANIGGMDITNSWSFSINPTAPVLTADATPTPILTIPMVPVNPLRDVIFDISAHIVFALPSAPPVPSGAITFQVRTTDMVGAPMTTVAPIYNESRYIDLPLVGVIVTVEPAHDAVQIVAQGIDFHGPQIAWTAMCSVVRTEVLHQ